MLNNKRLSFGMVFLYYLFIYSLRLSTGLIISALYFIFYKLDLLDLLFENIFMTVIALSVIIVIISIPTNILSNWSVLKSLDVVLDSMKKLESGDFSVRINKHKLFSPTPLMKFSDVFNTLAEELESIEMLRSDFVNNFSHEFKTPIVSMRGFASLLRETDLSNEKRKEYVDIIISESDRLAALATSVLNLSKIESQTILTGCEYFEMGEGVRQAILILEHKWAEKNLDIEIVLDDVEYYGNNRLLREVWLNILDNAVKFSDPGGKLIVKIADSPDKADFSVRDFGRGMDKFSVKHIFDKFYQGDTSRSLSGYGLGMSIVKKIVDLHGGLVIIDSEPDKGTTTIVSLPKSKHSVL
jgi:signal transduction histidine kinase